jgi:carbon storage regulator
MLVLSRKLGETIFIGQDVTLSVVEIKGSRVKLGIEAPQDVEVLRGELCVEQSTSAAEALPQTAFGN